MLKTGSGALVRFAATPRTQCFGLTDCAQRTLLWSFFLKSGRIHLGIHTSALHASFDRIGLNNPGGGNSVDLTWCARTLLVLYSHSTSRICAFLSSAHGTICLCKWTCSLMHTSDRSVRARRRTMEQRVMLGWGCGSQLSWRSGPRLIALPWADTAVTTPTTVHIVQYRHEGVGYS